MRRRTEIHRRETLKALASAAGMAALGSPTLLTGCTSADSTRAIRYQRPLSRLPFTAPRVSEDRVVRVIAGLRPYRPSGFVVEREAFDNKTVIHNYGHGGGGISLAWGSSALAVLQVKAQTPGRAAVLGMGIMGLTTARLLQEAGWQVTIYSRAPERHSVSNVGGGQWAPTSVFDERVATPAFIEQYKWASKISHHAYQNHVGADYGVSFIENYYLSEQPQEGGFYIREMPELFTSVRDLEPGEHPFPTRYVKQTVTMLIEPAQFLRRVRNDFFIAGGKVVTKDFGGLDDVLALEENTLFNCTGLGAKALFGDEELTPIKGQLVLMPPDPAVDYLTVGGGSDVSYMFSRRGEILLGGSWEMGNWDRTPDPDVTSRIVSDHQTLFSQFG